LRKDKIASARNHILNMLNCEGNTIKCVECILSKLIFIFINCYNEGALQMTTSYQLAQLDQHNAMLFSQYTYSVYKYKLCNNLLNTLTVAIGATFHQQPIALLLANIQQDTSFIHIVSIFVDKEHQNKGVATQLVQKLEEFALKKSFSSLSCECVLGKNYSPIIQRVLEKCGWSPSEHISTVFRCRHQSIPNIEDPWWVNYTLPKGKEEIFLWKDLKTEEHLQIQKTLSYPSYLSPFVDEELIEPLNSLGVRLNAKIVGWMITHRLRHDTILYRSLYVEPSVRNTGLAAKLCARSFQLQYAVREQIPNAMLTIHSKNSNVTPITNHWMKHYIVSKSTIMHLQKNISK